MIVSENPVPLFRIMLWLRPGSVFPPAGTAYYFILKIIVKGGWRPPTTVVPAQAGTHTPQQMLSAGLVVPAMRNNDKLWLWVPAFAHRR
ncbi:hypothetical protein A6X20_34815 [Bradyrhizobium elkanii]|nr:hypothetical protein A6X20_34815 [Bradyrhizobium elkanii]ODM75854.1 hypothetical protein A6452_36295 [Bradyrhizobium elkanii]